MGPQYIFKNLNFDFPTENNVAILGKNGAGKSTLFRMLAKSEYPDKGRVLTNKAMSWPVALQTGVHPQMTGRENTRFIGRINNVKSLPEYEEKVQAFAEWAKRKCLANAQFREVFTVSKKCSFCGCALMNVCKNIQNIWFWDAVIRQIMKRSMISWCTESSLRFMAPICATSWD